MTSEQPGRREFSQLVADHVFSNKDRNVAFAIVNAERQPDHVGRDGRTARPGPDRLRFRAAARDASECLLQAEIDKRAFLE